MKNHQLIIVITSILFILFSCAPSIQEAAVLQEVKTETNSLTLEGTYKGQKIYVQNPSVGDAWCTTGVVVNGSPILHESEFSKNAFVIDLEKMDFEIGDKVIVKIYHKPGCKPKVLNQETH